MKFKTTAKQIILKSLAVIFAVFCLPIFFIACNKSNSKAKDMDYYSLLTSSYTLITGYDEIKTITTDFTHSEKIFRQYDKITINLSSEWLYSCQVEELRLDITTNQTTELQLKVTITNLKEGAYAHGLEVKNKQYTIYNTFEANVASTQTISINDIFELAAAKTCVIIELDNTEVYSNTDLSINSFAFSINNLTIIGEHVYS